MNHEVEGLKQGEIHPYLPQVSLRFIIITITIQRCVYWAGSCKKHDGLKQGGRDPQLLVDWGTRSFLLHPPLNTGHRAGHSWRYYVLVPKLRSPARQDTTEPPGVYKCTSNPRYVAPPNQCAPNSNHTPTTNPQRYLVLVPPSPPSAPKPQPQIQESGCLMSQQPQSPQGTFCLNWSPT